MNSHLSVPRVRRRSAFATAISSDSSCTSLFSDQFNNQAFIHSFIQTWPGCWTAPLQTGNTSTAACVIGSCLLLHRHLCKVQLKVILQLSNSSPEALQKLFYSSYPLLRGHFCRVQLEVLQKLSYSSPYALIHCFTGTSAGCSLNCSYNSPTVLLMLQPTALQALLQGAA
eukprot:1145401-Pelagomonas_calceolata.AAC.10